METIHLDKGHFIYRPPQRITPIFEIETEAVKIGAYSPDGVEPGDFFGNLRHMNGQFSEFAKTLSSVELRAIAAYFLMVK
ncbi:MAG: hypothetical protein WD431_24165 [Cyclobacteriaceae bacterium]